AVAPAAPQGGGAPSPARHQVAGRDDERPWGTLEVTMAWYIESWDVVDGQAFGGLRLGDGMTPRELVFVAPPSFAPVPVRDSATALWGTRGTFQEGFIGEDDREVVFPSLEHLIETVRRAYLAGGVEGGSPPEGGAPGPGPDTNPPPPNGGSGRDKRS